MARCVCVKYTTVRSINLAPRRALQSAIFGTCEWHMYFGTRQPCALAIVLTPVTTRPDYTEGGVFKTV
jgi:hypothetical protein